MQIINRITEEIEAYKTGSVKVVDGYTFSAFKTIRRIMLYKNQIYPTGKRDSQGNYKYWFDIISPRVNDEIKNYGRKMFSVISDASEDFKRLLLANVRLKEFLRETGQIEKLDEAVEVFVEWGNSIHKKVQGDYVNLDLTKVYVLNQKAKTLKDSDVIEYEVMTPIDIRKNSSAWKNVEELMEKGDKEHDKSVPEFHIYERNGEITTRELMEAQDKDGGDDKTYILAKITVGGVEEGAPSEVLFAEEIKAKDKKKIYKEAHRGKYSGRWLRVGMYEALFEQQTRYNEVINQIARGLEHAAHTIYRSADRITAQNILTDLQNGDIVKSADLQQVLTRMDGFDQLMANLNKIEELADRIANSPEVVSGAALPSGTPDRLAGRLDFNANKLFEVLRLKLAHSLEDIIEEWILPDLLKDLKAKTVLKITADSGFLGRYYETVVNSWYTRNLIAIGPHTPEIAQALKEQKMEELMKNQETSVDLEKDMWDEFKLRARVTFGEDFALNDEIDDIQRFIELEHDPVRRTALIELAMKKTGNVDVEKLPKTPPQPVQEQQRPQRQEQKVV